MPYHVLIEFLNKDNTVVDSREFTGAYHTLAMSIDERLLRMEVNNRRNKLEWKKIIVTAERNEDA